MSFMFHRWFYGSLCYFSKFVSYFCAILCLKAVKKSPNFVNLLLKKKCRNPGVTLLICYNYRDHKVGIL